MNRIESAVGEPRTIPSPATSLREENRTHLIAPPLEPSDPPRRLPAAAAVGLIAAGALVAGGLALLMLKQRS